jgi:hypothetical protein
VLVSPQQHAKWPADAPLIAECARSSGLILGWSILGEEPEEGHAAPDPGCSCGVYATEHPTGCLPYLTQPNTVLARVEGYGLVVPGSKGWRAERARVVSLTRIGTADDALVDEVAARYGVDVVDEQLDLPAWTDEDAAAIAALGVSAKTVAAAMQRVIATTAAHHDALTAALWNQMLQGNVMVISTARQHGKGHSLHQAHVHVGVDVATPQQVGAMVKTKPNRLVQMVTQQSKHGHAHVALQHARAEASRRRRRR